MKQRHPSKSCKHGHVSGRYASGDCIECARICGAKYRAANLERVREGKAASYKVNREKIAAKAQSYRRANIEVITAREKRYQRDNADTIRARKSAYGKQHRAQGNARNRKWYYVSANPEKLKANARRNYVKHIEKRRASARAYAAANCEVMRARVAAYKRANPDIFAVLQQRRKARQRGVLGTGVTIVQWRDVLVESLGICAYCNERRNLTMDHIEPLMRGGEHDIDNIAAVCGRCNSSKGRCSLLLWMQRRARARLAEAA